MCVWETLDCFLFSLYIYADTKETANSANTLADEGISPVAQLFKSFPGQKILYEALSNS